MAAVATVATWASSWRDLGSVQRPLARARGTSSQDAWYCLKKTGGSVSSEGVGFGSEGLADRRGRGGKHGGGDGERVGGPSRGGGEAVARKAGWS